MSGSFRRVKAHSLELRERVTLILPKIRGLTKFGDRPNVGEIRPIANQLANPSYPPETRPFSSSGDPLSRIAAALTPSLQRSYGAGNEGLLVLRA